MQLSEIPENIQKAKEIIKAVDLTIIELDKGYKEPAVAVWQKVRRDFAFGISDSRQRYNQAKQIVAHMKSLIYDIIDGLKNVSNRVPEYRFNDYGIEQEITAFYNHLKNTKIFKIKDYTPHKDIETLTSISEKASSIIHDLSGLQKEFQ